MGEPGRQPAQNDEASLMDLDAGIEALEKGQATDAIRIDFGEGVVGSVHSESTLDALLQRARGLRLISLMAARNPVDRPPSMRTGKPALHPVVEEILDALR